MGLSGGLSRGVRREGSRRGRGGSHCWERIAAVALQRLAVAVRAAWRIEVGEGSGWLV